MASTAPPTRQRAIALAAALADDRAAGPLALLGASSFGPEARGLALELLAGPEGASRERLAGLEAELLAGRRPGPRPRPGGARPLPAIRRVAEALGEPAGGGPLPAGLLALGREPMGLLAGLTLALLRRAAASEELPVRVVRGAGAAAGEVSPRVAPGLLWLALALSADEGAAEALAACWPPALGRALLAAQGRFALEVAAEAAAEERARLELELASLG